MKRSAVTLLLLTLTAAAGRAGDLQAVFPEENPALVFVEGEEAVATNFAREPILNYSCSSSRSLQLNRGTGLAEGRAYYATFVFYIDEPGSYELWYGGTPPGPRDDLYASYSSPFALRLDGGKPAAVYREDVSVVERYAPAYYWNRVRTVELGTGSHTLELEVGERRRYDNRYFFYLDCFFLLRKGSRPGAGPLPKVFPGNLEDRSIDFPFRALEDYQIAVRDRPDEVRPCTDLALMYSLLGDYLNALKYLRRAELLEPGNREVALLAAKNRIWKGDTAEGLKGYRALLLLEPRRLDWWLEAGKVAAWVGRYEDSVSFYKNALDQFPGELALLANLGLTYLWSGKGEEADRVFRQAAEAALADPVRLLELADVYFVNGAPQRAVQLLGDGIRRFPDRLALYLALERIHSAGDAKDKAAEVRRLIDQTFAPSPQLARYLEGFERRQSLRAEVIQAYREELAAQPDNLVLREVLARTYFWNGERRLAIEETLDLLANHAFLALGPAGLDRDAAPLEELLDASYTLQGFLDALPARQKALEAGLASARAGLGAANRDYQEYQARVKAARDKGQTPPAVAGEDPLDRLRRAEAALDAAAAQAAGFAAQVARALESWRGYADRLEQLSARERESAAAFDNKVKATRWEWDRQGFLKELESRPGPLAEYDLAKVYLAERRPAAAENLLRGAGGTTAARTHALFQALLWQGKTEQAYLALEGAPAGLPDYLAALRSWRSELAASPAASAPAEEAEKALKAAAAAGANARRELAPVQAALHALLGRRLPPVMLHLEQDTAGLRNELGDYYLTEGRLEEATRQFRLVLGVDPWDVDAVFRLGKAYEQQRDWRDAMALFRRAYFIDPSYENVTGQYNTLARRHADAVELGAHTLADTTRRIVHAEAAYRTELSSAVGLEFSYRADGTRVYQDVFDPGDPSGFTVQDLEVGLPLSLLGARLRLTPRAGVHLQSLLYDDAELPGDTVSAWEYLGFARAFPHAGLEAAGNLGKRVAFAGGYTFGRQEETFAPKRPAIWRHAGELNLNADLSAVGLRTYGQIQLLTDGGLDNVIATVLQEASLRLLDRSEPGLRLDLLGNVLLQNSEKYRADEAYYTPIGVLIAGAGLRFSAGLPAGEGNSLNLGLRGAAASYQEKVFDPADLIGRLQLEGEASAGLTLGEATYTLRAQFSTTYCYRYGGQPAKEKQWDYWSLYLSLGCSARLPRLLAP